MAGVCGSLILFVSGGGSASARSRRSPTSPAAPAKPAPRRNSRRSSRSVCPFIRALLVNEWPECDTNERRAGVQFRSWMGLIHASTGSAPGGCGWPAGKPPGCAAYAAASTVTRAVTRCSARGVRRRESAARGRRDGASFEKCGPAPSTHRISARRVGLRKKRRFTVYRAPIIARFGAGDFVVPPFYEMDLDGDSLDSCLVDHNHIPLWSAQAVS